MLLAQNEQCTPLNFSDRLVLEFERTPPSYYLLCGPDATAHPALRTKAEKCSIRLSDVKVTAAAFELGEQQMKQYVSQFTDTYRFTCHTIQNYSHQTGPQQYSMEITKDVLPNKSAMCLKHKIYNTGYIVINPHIMYKLPNGGKTQFFVNSSSMYDTMLDTSKPRDIYKRLKENLMPNNTQCLINIEDYDVNSTNDASNSGYTICSDTLTFTYRNPDGSVTEDRRNAGLNFHVEFSPGITINDQYSVLFHLYDERVFAITTDGMVNKDSSTNCR